jgi:hypothetical protein
VCAPDEGEGGTARKQTNRGKEVPVVVVVVVVGGGGGGGVVIPPSTKKAAPSTTTAKEGVGVWSANSRPLRTQPGGCQVAVIG